MISGESQYCRRNYRWYQKWQTQKSAWVLYGLMLMQICILLLHAVGNMHGMPLSASIGEDNIESKVHDPDEKTKKEWDHLKNFGKINPKILGEDIVFISLRDLEKEEKHLVEKYGMKVISTNEMRRKGPESVVKAALRF